MNKRRLLKLADLLEADAKNKKGIKFDLCTFCTTKSPDYPVSCGTRACAIGLAALSGAFKRQGLEFEFRNEDDEPELYFIFEDMETWDGFVVAERFFDLERYEANFLFATHAVTINNGAGAGAERALAKKIRKFVATGELDNSR